MSNLASLYLDAMVSIARHVENAEDLLALSQTCKIAYRAVRKKEFRRKIAFPFKRQYKMTPEQFKCMRTMLENCNSYKLVCGDVGSGKTWLAIGYMMHKYIKAIQNRVVAIMIVVPPSLVAQWSEFLRDFTDLRVLSNYKSSCFYEKNYHLLVNDYDIFIVSNITSGNMEHYIKSSDSEKEFQRKIVILHDEAHNDAACSRFGAAELIGFTASFKTFEKRRNDGMKWKQFKLKSSMLRENLPPIKFITYDHVGYTDRARKNVKFYLSSVTKSGNIPIRSMKCCLIYLSYDDTTYIDMNIFNGRKRIRYKGYGAGPEYTSIEAVAKLLDEVPKMRAIRAIATKVVAAGEKLICFDTDQSFLHLVWAYLTHFGFRTNIFTTAYSAADRPKQIEKFKKNGHVLLGSIRMLSEGHNITEANNILFIRYPNSADEFKQAIGRCHRNPQKREVKIHMITSCELELTLALKGMETGYTKIRRREYTEVMSEFTNSHLVDLFKRVKRSNNDHSDDTEEL